MDKQFWRYLIHHLKKDPILDWAATLAYYFMLSIFPLLIFLIALIPYFNVDITQIEAIINDFIPQALAEIITTIVLDTIGEPRGGLLSIGVIVTLWSASSGINAFVRAINRSYNIEETRNFLRQRLLSMLMTFGILFMIIITLLLPVFGATIINLLEQIFFLPEQITVLLNILRYVIAIILMILVLIVFYWIAPNIKVKIRNVIWGAIFATIGWQAISFGFSFYLSHFANYSATYGSLGGVIILMLWFFLTGIILVIGGQINAALYESREKTTTMQISDLKRNE
ncbi:ribonuclease yfkH [Alkalihalobacillus alcalophilus ATCC 27647 = CGMCC 1.3604]|uniref:Ribonuclease n=1 Tax=Alkalihalobacillus alcalophilus ATCC 27647 = CGMCC 1.3604 TaxID=1218173 RepID=A0A094WIL7_ALKAL|nr:YihY/virulence factor BrkB family protein [Alkalihalobacillus alcalophilus]KGA95748.1 ribonuclease [Alkalihalobacillus alcalophilus ATCC 27647 = CGMCC 1.3604]MED1563639.1 YihY/virulence factor BrkB family protein [Alkalihalobacillus alcalophilus]THG88906.1 ribonuclease yfkH [Alkalihalobacillus alcalophilus ATCC 27647 = CGMCC 1.3604]